MNYFCNICKSEECPKTKDNNIDAANCNKFVCQYLICSGCEGESCCPINYIEKKDTVCLTDAENIAIRVIKNNGDLWWRLDRDTSACEAHRIDIELSGNGIFKLRTTCNCDSQNGGEACGKDSWALTEMKWIDLIEQLRLWLELHDHYETLK